MQPVIVNDKSYEHKNVTRCIPQGSMLGPLLFIIFINDLPEQVKSEIFRQINRPDDHSILQEDTNNMLDWANKWQLEFHPDKCVSISINRKMNYNEAYKMETTELRQVRQEKDIGVIVNN